MDEALEILDYLPYHFKSPAEQEYIDFLWDTFQSNYENEKYQFALIAYHMLFMSFVYFNIWQIKDTYQTAFQHSLIGFSNNIEKNFAKTDISPFAFSEAQEAKIFSFLKLIGVNQSKIGNYKKLVSDRNDIAHCNGNISFNSVESLERKISDYLKFAKEIQTVSQTTIQSCFRNFLIDAQDEEERAYIGIEEEIQEELIHRNYLSRKDLDFCLAFDISELSSQPNFTEIENIFAVLQDLYME